jgi:hypothetical protein
MNIVQHPKNRRLIAETNRFFEYVEGTLVPANKQYLRVNEDALENLKQEFHQAKASAQKEIDEAVAKGSSQREAYECSNMSNIKEKYGYDISDFEIQKDFITFHMTMSIVVSIQSFVEGTLKLICKQKLTPQEFQKLILGKWNFIQNCLEILPTSEKVSLSDFPTFESFKDYRNEYIHDQFAAREKESAVRNEEEHSYDLENVTIQTIKFTEISLKDYAASAKALLVSVIEKV